MVELNQTEIIVTDRLASSGAALREIGAIDERKTGLWLNGTVNLPNGGRAKTGAFPWRYAATPSSAISRHAMIAPERSARSSDDNMAWWGKVWRLATPSWMETKRWRCRADLNRFMIGNPPQIEGVHL